MPEKETKMAGKAPGGKPIFNMKAAGRLVKLLWHDYPQKLTLVVICIAINALVAVAPSIFIKNMTEQILIGLESGWAAIAPAVFKMLGMMVVVYAIGLAANATYSQIMATVTQGFLHNLRTRMFDRMQDLPVKYFDTHNHGDIMSHYTNDADTLRQLIAQSLPALCNTTIVVTALIVVMIYYSFSLMIVMLVGIFAMFKVTKNIGGRSALFFRKQQETLGQTEGYIEEMMNGQKVIKVFCHEEATEAGFDKLNEALFKDAETANKYGNIFMPIIGNIGNILYVLMAFVGGLLITSHGAVPNISIMNMVQTGSFAGAMTIPLVATYLGMVKQFTGNVGQVSQQINAVAMALAGADRVFQLLDEEPEEDEGNVTLVNCRMAADGTVEPCAERTNHWAWRVPREDGGADYTPLAGDVRFNDVDFGYEPGKTVLHHITLYAKPGQKLAFVGPTGAGKTTITNLINRFYDIADGKIRYDGININHIKKADLRRSLGVVLQDVNLFTGTVMDNIRYGRLDATDEECIEAAKLANAHDFITRLPEGYQTMLRNNAANLSQGQRQLISIARAAVADPPVMILDEATSSIDTRTELLVQKGMDALMEGRTVFVIAHRLSTIQNSDAIMVLDHGSIIERGDHDQLMAEKGVYYRLYTGALEMD